MIPKVIERHSIMQIARKDKTIEQLLKQIKKDFEKKNPGT